MAVQKNVDHFYIKRIYEETKSKKSVKSGDKIQEGWGDTLSIVRYQWRKGGSDPGSCWRREEEL